MTSSKWAPAGAMTVRKPSSDPGAGRPCHAGYVVESPGANIIERSRQDDPDLMASASFSGWLAPLGQCRSLDIKNNLV